MAWQDAVREAISMVSKEIEELQQVKDTLEESINELTDSPAVEFGRTIGAAFAKPNGEPTEAQSREGLREGIKVFLADKNARVKTIAEWSGADLALVEDELENLSNEGLVNEGKRGWWELVK